MHSMRKQCFIPLTIVLILGIRTVSAADWRVSNGRDDGQGSFRWALENCLQSAGADTITFEIPKTDSSFTGTIWCIRLQSVLPNLTGASITILGESQTANQGDSNPQGPEIYLIGSDLGDDGYGISLVSAGNTVSHLGFSGFTHYGISVWQSVARNNRIRGCSLGLLVVDGDSLTNSTGIFLTGGACATIIGGSGTGEGNIFSGNEGDGIHISGADSTLIIGNIIGTYPAYGLAGNGGDGIDLRTGTRGTRVGNGDAEGANLICGNGVNGISISEGGTSGNIIQKNYIGTDLTGSTGLGNGYDGIRIYNDASANVIGDEDKEKGNIIASNSWYGIDLSGAGVDSNLVQGNYIGTSPDSISGLGNGSHGVALINGPSSNQIGPNNTIYNNGGSGVYITDGSSAMNTISRNSISRNSAGGIALTDGANGGIGAPDIITVKPLTGTAPPLSAVELFADSASQGRTYLGAVNADASGNFSWPGITAGPFVTATATDAAGNTSEFSPAARIGASQGISVTTTRDGGEHSLRWAIEEANTLTGPDTIVFSIPPSDSGYADGVWRFELKSLLPAVTGNNTTIDGFSQTESQGDSNSAGPELFLNGEGSDIQHGLTVYSGNNIIRGLIVSGFHVGILCQGHLADYNHIYGNYIGVDPTGTSMVPNYQGILIFSGANKNLIGGTNDIERNLISGNINDAIHIDISDSNVVIGNFMGTDRSGTLALPNGSGGLGDGVDIRNGSCGNRVGGTTPGERNIISGNNSAGVRIHYPWTTGNIIIGNYIGTDVSGTIAIPNNLFGVHIHEGASGNRIGGTGPGEGNLISGNCSGFSIANAGSDNNRLEGNLIGLDATGGVALPNLENGVYLHSGVRNNIIGPGNIISGNAMSGVLLAESGTDSNRVIGNWIGLTASGGDTLANGNGGVKVETGACFSEIGAEGQGNVVSGNRRGGIIVADSSCRHTRILANYCGTDTAAAAAFGNSGPGLDIRSRDLLIRDNIISGNNGPGVFLRKGVRGASLHNNLIGTGLDTTRVLPNLMSGILIADSCRMDSVGPGNVIAYNNGCGVRLDSAGVGNVTITANAIFNNDSGAVSIVPRANGGIQPPVIASAHPLEGTAAAGARIEIFSDSSDEARVYEGFTSADGSGNWSWEGSLTGPRVSASATDTAGNTSALSSPWLTDVGEDEPASIHSFHLDQNYPNPFNGSTTIRFGLPARQQVSLRVYNMLGRMIRVLAERSFEAGNHTLTFESGDLPSGLYFYRLKTGSFISVRKMVIIE